MPYSRRFKQVDVFTSLPFRGNPLAVVLDADGLTDVQMQEIARWTNLSETSFVLPATDAVADYCVRIFSPDREFPFAGHPTLGTAHALLESGLQAKSASRIIQQCGIGLVTIEKNLDGTLAFRAPAAQLESLDETWYPLLLAALGKSEIDSTMPAIKVLMGVKWLVVRMASAATCLAVRGAQQPLAELMRCCSIDGVAIYGRHTPEGPADYEVRTLYSEFGMLIEDPVTGSANACIARVLQAQGFPDGHPSAKGYRMRQGTMLQRDGQLFLIFRDGEPWVGGHSVTVVDGLLQA